MLIAIIPQDPQGVVLATAKGMQSSLLNLLEKEILFTTAFLRTQVILSSILLILFWTTLVRYLAKVESIEDINVPTGVLSFSTEKN